MRCTSISESAQPVVDGARSGEHRSLQRIVERLFQETSSSTTAYFRRRGFGDLSEDLANECFLILLKKLRKNSVDLQRPLKPYIFGVAAKVALAQRRKQPQDRWIQDSEKDMIDTQTPPPVSYTHLTLPTIYSV